MPLQIVRNDITQMKVDAIVNAANESLLGGGGVDGAIHRAAGPRLLAECRKLNGCPTGEAKITHAYRLPAKYVIHTVGPIWRGGSCREAELLASCYWKSLYLAKANKCETIAFPLISAGAYGYPKDQAFRIAVNTVQEFLKNNDMTVYIVVFDAGSYFISRERFEDVRQYIDQRYVDAHTEPRTERLRRQEVYGSLPPEGEICAQPVESCSVPLQTRNSAGELWRSLSLEDALNHMDEGFSDMLLRKIDESGMTDAQCYKKANIDRKLFSKIRSDKNYKPSKRTAVALCIALELSLSETRRLLSSAGIALTHANKFDIIIEYFITRRNYDIFEINDTLLSFDQPLLGV